MFFFYSVSVSRLITSLLLWKTIRLQDEHILIDWSSHEEKRLAKVSKMKTTCWHVQILVCLFSLRRTKRKKTRVCIFLFTWTATTTTKGSRQWEKTTNFVRLNYMDFDGKYNEKRDGKSPGKQISNSLKATNTISVCFKWSANKVSGQKRVEKLTNDGYFEIPMQDIVGFFFSEYFRCAGADTLVNYDTHFSSAFGSIQSRQQKEKKNGRRQ